MAMSPFHSTPPAEVPLSRSPLTLVAVQVDFSAAPSLNEASVIQSLKREPFEKITRVPSTDNAGHRQDITNSYWYFHSGDHQTHLSISLTSIQLSTTSYTSRNETLQLLRGILTEASASKAITDTTRVGIRYINQLPIQDDFKSLRTSIKSPFLGPLAMNPSNEVGLAQLQTSAVMKVDERLITARWGLKPRGAAWVPGLSHQKTVTWVLDTEVARDEELDGFDPSLILVEVEKDAKIAYDFFRFVVTENFIDESM